MQSKRKLIIASFDIAVTLLIEGSDTFIKTFCNHPFWREFVPGLSHSSSRSDLQQWTIRESPECAYDLQNRTIATNQETIIPAIVIIEAAIERHRQESGLFTLHGSTIGKDDYAVGFIGAVSGLGKTTLCAHATADDWTWLSDEKFTIDKTGILLGGVANILNDEKTRQASKNVRPTGMVTPRQLKLLCIPLVTNEPTATAHLLERHRAEWQLYDETTRDIRQINGVIHGFSTPLPSLDTEGLARSRQELAVDLSATLPLLFIRGNEESILQEITTQLAN